MLFIFIFIYWRLGGGADREIDFGFGCGCLACVRAKLCAGVSGRMLLPELGRKNANFVVCRPAAARPPTLPGRRKR